MNDLLGTLGAIVLLCTAVVALVIYSSTDSLALAVGAAVSGGGQALIFFALAGVLNRLDRVLDLIGDEPELAEEEPVQRGM